MITLFFIVLSILLIFVLHIIGAIFCIAYMGECIAYLHGEVKEEKERKKARKERAKLAKNNPDYVFIEI